MSQQQEAAKQYATLDGLYFLPDTKIYLRTVYPPQVQVNIVGSSPKQMVMLPNNHSLVLQKGSVYEVLDLRPLATPADSLKKTKSLFKIKTMSRNRSGSGSSIKHISTSNLVKNEPVSPVSSNTEDEQHDQMGNAGGSSLLRRLTRRSVTIQKRNGSKGSLNDTTAAPSSPTSPTQSTATLPFGDEQPRTLSNSQQSISNSRPTSPTDMGSSTVAKAPTPGLSATVGLPASIEMNCEGWLRIYQTAEISSEPLWFKLENDQLNGYVSRESKNAKLQFLIPNRCFARPMHYEATPVPGVWPFKLFLWQTTDVLITLVAHTEDEMARWIASLNTYIANRMAIALLNGIEYTAQGSESAYKTDPNVYYRKEIQTLTLQLRSAIGALKYNESDEDSAENLKQLKRDRLASTNGSAPDLEQSSNMLTVNTSRLSIEDTHVRWAYLLLEEAKSAKNENPCIHPSQVLEKLADEDISVDPDYIECFLLIYRHWYTAEELISQLSERYKLSSSNYNESEHEYLLKWRPVIRLRVLSIVKRWVEFTWSDFCKGAVRTKLDNLLSAAIDGDGSTEDKFARADMKKIGEMMKEYIQLLEGKFNEKRASASVTTTAKKSKIEFMNLPSEKEVAEQLTLLEFERYKHIQPAEFFISLYSKKDDPDAKFDMIHLQEVIEGFNMLSYWVGTEICTQPDVKQRVKVLERMINLAKEFRNLNNFNSLLAVVSGLNTASVQRLKSTWELVSPKLMQTFHELEDMVDPKNNFRKYRDLLQQIEGDWLSFWEKQLFSARKSPGVNGSGAVLQSVQSLAQSPPPLAGIGAGSSYSMTTLNSRSKNKDIIIQPDTAIPIISLFLKDLTFLSDGNPKFFEDTRMFNYGKAKTMFTSVQKTLFFQKGRYDFQTSDDVKEFCRNLRALKENALYKYSQLAENKQQGGRLIDKWVKESS